MVSQYDKLDDFNVTELRRKLRQVQEGIEVLREKESKLNVQRKFVLRDNDELTQKQRKFVVIDEQSNSEREREIAKLKEYIKQCDE